MSFIQKAVVHGDIAGAVQIRNIFYAQVSSTVLDTYQSLWGLYLNSVLSNIANITSTVVTWPSAEIYEWSNSEWVHMDDISLTNHGTATGDYLPNLVAAVLTGKLVGNRAFGRKFFSGIGEGMTTANGFTTQAMTNLVAAAAAYVSVLTGPNSGILGPGLFLKDHTFHSFGLGIVSSLLGSMRRRKPGLGI